MVYFIQPVDGGHIKIGTTIRLSERLRTLAREAGKELRVLAVVDGGYEEEKSLHDRFAHLKVVNELFEPGDDLLGFIVEAGQEWDGSDEAKKTESTKIDGDILRDARIVAAVTGEGLSEYLSRLLRPLVARDKEQALEREKTGHPPKKK